MASSTTGEVPPGTSGSNRSKQAMDIRIEELTDREVQLLTALLSRRPSFGIGRPSKRWLEHQTRLVAALPPEIRRPQNLLKRFVVKYAAALSGNGGDGSVLEYPPAVLCSAHYELHPRLMRRLFVVVLDEVTRHADRLRRWVSATTAVAGDGEIREAEGELVAFVDRVDSLGALWMEPQLYLETFHAPPTDRRLVKVESYCEACTLAVLGANARTLADIRAIIVDRAERLRERRERRRLMAEEEKLKRHEERSRRKEEKREKRRREWEEEERMLEDAKRDPERKQWVHSGRAADAEKERSQLKLDEIEARHRRHHERESKGPHRGHHHHRSSRSGHHDRGGSKNHRNDDGDNREQGPSRPRERDPRLLRIVELWIDHLGSERAAIARRMSEESLDMLRQYRGVIDRARTSRQRVKRARRGGIPVAGAAPANNPEDAVELRRKAADFKYRNAAAARSVYRPDSLAGGMSQVGGIDLDNMPPPPMCGNSSVDAGYGARPGAPEPSGGRYSGFSSNQAPSPGFVQRFEREVQLADGEVIPGLDPYDYDDYDDLDEEIEQEEEDAEDEDGANGYYGAQDERDYEREERSREKVAAWAVNTWAQSHRDLSGAELERGARSVIDGMHPAFRPSAESAGHSHSPATSNPYSCDSAVPLPLTVGNKDRDASSGKMRASSILGSALGLNKGNNSSSSNKKRHAEEEKEKEKKDRKGKEKEKEEDRYAVESTAWTDVTVHTDWRDHSHHHHQPNPRDAPPPPPVPRMPSRYGTRSGARSPPPSPLAPPVVSMVAGVDPGQSTETFPAYADQLPGDPVSPSLPPQLQNSAPPPPLPSWSPAKKPSRKYCFPDSDIGSAVRGTADKQYLRKNRGFLREVPPDANPFVASSPDKERGKGNNSSSSRGTSRQRLRDPDDGDYDDDRSAIAPGAKDDPWAPYERAANSSSSSRKSASTTRLSAARSAAASRNSGSGSGSNSNSNSNRSRSTAPTSVPGVGGGGSTRAPTPMVATAEEEKRWRREWGVTAEEEAEDFIRPDDSASNVHWARQAAGDDVTQLGDLMRRAG